MRAAIVILVCLVAFLVLCFVGAGTLLWQRVNYAANQALYTERVQAAIEQARLRVELDRRGADGEANPTDTASEQISNALKETLVAITYGEEKERISGLLALSQQTEGSDAVLKALIGSLKDDSMDVRSLAATLLGNMGEDAAPAAFALGEKFAEPAVREAALYALQAIGPAGDGAIAPLEALLDAADPTVQDAARKALRGIRE